MPPGDAAAWRQALEQLARQPQAFEPWGAQGLLALHSRFSMVACARSIAAQYRMSQNEPAPQPDQSPEQSSLLIVIPARDEATTIGQVVSALIASGWQHIFVIDDHPERASRLRQLAWRWFRAIAGFELRDLTSGFRCYNRLGVWAAEGFKRTPFWS